MKLVSGSAVPMLCALALLSAGQTFAQSQPTTAVKEDSRMKPATSVTIEADNPAIRYTGRIDFANPKAPSFAWPSVQVEARFEGSDIDVILADSGNKDYFAVTVDGGAPVVLQSARGSRPLQVARGLAPGDHSIRVWKRTEALCGVATFKGFVLPSGGKILPFESKDEHCIEFVGDSITCGYGNLVSTDNPENSHFTPANEDSSIAWGALAAKALGARYSCVAYSGRGLFRNNDGSEDGLMPQLYRAIYPDNLRKATWDTAKYLPEVIVINLGTNDYSSQIPKTDLSPKYFDQKFTAAYREFIQTLRGYYGPKVKIVCVVGPMISDSFPAGLDSLTRIQACVSGLVADLSGKGDASVFYLSLDPQSSPFGEDWHPSAATHKAIASVTADFIRSITGWK